MKWMMTYRQMKRMGSTLVPSRHVHHFSLRRHFSFFIYITYFSLLISHLLLTSCSGGSDSTIEEPTPYDGPSVLSIYVYAPGQSVPTRGNTGQVNAAAAEDAIHTLQIWVYSHETTPKLVTYFKTNAFQQDPQKTDDTYKFELPIDDTFADSNPDNRPTVDVYVLANVTGNNCGLDFNENTTKDALENAVLAEGYFGLSTPVTEVPYEGLPMSGVLRGMTITGSKPVLTLRESTVSEQMAKVKMARVVSKVRFVFSCSTDFDGLKITSVNFDEGMIPTQEYLFLDQDYTYEDNRYKIGNTYNDAVASLFSIDETAICADPAHYAWDRLQNDQPDCTAQDYEDLIADGLTIHEGETGPRLTERCLYLRESNKQLSGTIYYKVKEKGAANYGDEEPPVAFKMVGPEDPTEWQPYFSRNHTWIVYAYLAWAKMRVVDVHFKDWETTDPGEHSLYNW